MVAEFVERARYGDMDVDVRREIAFLQERAYRPSEPPIDPRTPLHTPALDAHSFLLRCDGLLVSYAAVVTTTISADGMRYLASGLSSVATDPDFTRRGYASRVVDSASRYIAASGVDMGVFTCAPNLTQLYTVAGDWLVAPDVRLVGSDQPDALSSTALGVVVLMRLFSARARMNSDVLHRATIDLGLPVGHFWQVILDRSGTGTVQRSAFDHVSG